MVFDRPAARAESGAVRLSFRGIGLQVERSVEIMGLPSVRKPVTCPGVSASAVQVFQL